jgi:beta-lactamase class A
LSIPQMTGVQRRNRHRARRTLDAHLMRLLVAAALALSIVVPARAMEDSALDSQLQTLIAPYQGKVGLYAIDLNGGGTVAIDADTPVPTASVIKLTVLFEALKQIEQGQAHFDDRLVLQKSDDVQGSGVLQFFDTPLSLTLKDALTMMVIESDNTATNLVVDHLGGVNVVDDRIRWMGLQNTWLYKKVFLPPVGPQPPDQPTFGLGKTTPREMAEVMQRFVTCNLDAAGNAPPQAPSPQDLQLCKAAMDMLENQQDQTGIPRYLPGLTVGNKTGAVDYVRNDVGVVYAKNGPIVISVFTHDNKDDRWTIDNPAYLTIARLAWTIVNAWE